MTCIKFGETSLTTIFFLFADETPKSRLRVGVLGFSNCSSILEIIDYISESRLQR